MSMNLDGFDANTVEPNAPRDPIPAGWYRAAIIESEEKPTKAQTGSYLNLKFEILEGPHAGRHVYDILNLNNPNQTAVEIAQRTLSAICRAVGVRTPKNSSDLHLKPVMILVAIEPPKDGRDANNKIKGYEPITGAAAQAAKPTVTTGNPFKKGISPAGGSEAPF